MSGAMAAAEAAAQQPLVEGEQLDEATAQPAPELPALTRRELFILHGGLVLTNVIWSVMHIVMSVPLRRGSNVAVISVYREVIGAAALGGAAYALERHALLARAAPRFSRI